MTTELISATRIAFSPRSRLCLNAENILIQIQCLRNMLSMMPSAGPFNMCARVELYLASTDRQICRFQEGED